VNEIVQLYELFRRVYKDSQHTFSDELRASLPKSRREYEENINFEEFERVEEEEEALKK
jgi:hypothetical protein